MKPVMAYYYATNRCNAKCKFCNLWTEKPVREPTVPELNENVGALRRLGIKYIDFTGGEPFLYKHIDEALKIAKENKLLTSINTNGTIYPKRARDVLGYLDYLQVSLDYPDAERHDTNRGVPCYRKVFESIDKAKEIGQNIGICWTATNDNVDDIEAMIEICKKYDIILGVNYLYSYFGNDGITHENAKKVKKYFKDKNVTYDLAALSFIKHGGNDIGRPICKASKSTIVISPNNYYITPCYQHKFKQQKIDGNLEELYYQTPHKDGASDVCKGCTMWCYLKPSFLYHPASKYFYLYLFDLVKNYFARTRN